MASRKLKDELIDLIAEFFRVAKLSVRARLDVELLKPGIHVAAAWNRANPTTVDDITRFYQETDSYVYDLAANCCRPQCRAISNVVVQRIERRGAPQDVLLYGDGIGTDSLELARRGHSVTYFDVPGITSRFAKFRFGRAGMTTAIRVIGDVEAIPSGCFDAVVCIEVLEHLPDPPRALREIFRVLKPGGVAIVTESFGAVGPQFPSHLPQNARYEGAIHRMMESQGFANTYYNTRPVNYPMEFTRVSPGITGKLLRWFFRMRRAVKSRVRRHRDVGACQGRK